MARLRWPSYDRLVSGWGGFGQRVAWAVALVVVVALLVSACGGDEGDGSSTPAQHPPTTREAPPMTPPEAAPQQATGLSFSADDVSFTKGNFKYELSVNLTVGEPTTSTEGLRPPLVNLAAPLSGDATLTNVTPNYSVDNPYDIPVTAVFALYPPRTAVCEKADGESMAGPTKKLCAMDVAAFAAGCDRTYTTPLAEGESWDFIPWGTPSTETFTQTHATLGNPSFCRDYTDAAEEQLFPDQMLLGPLESADAEEAIEQLPKPKYLVLLVLDGGDDCITGQVLASKPKGITGCLDLK